jgi:hypothetical protein
MESVAPSLPAALHPTTLWFSCNATQLWMKILLPYQARTLDEMKADLWWVQGLTSSDSFKLAASTNSISVGPPTIFVYSGSYFVIYVCLAEKKLCHSKQQLSILREMWNIRASIGWFYYQAPHPQ